MKIGDTVKFKHITDFEGIILSPIDWVHDEYGENELKTWKEFWYQHQYDGKPPYADDNIETAIREA